MKLKILFIAIIAIFLNSCKKETKAVVEALDDSSISIKDKLKGVIGGNQISINNAPYQVAVFRNDGGRAGGVILNENWILTAAHVVTDGFDQQIPASQLIIRAGSSSVNGGETINVDQVIRHPNYTSGSINNDIALIHLATPLTYTINILPINYDKNSTSVAVNDLAVVSGWGLIAYNENLQTGTSTTDLYAADVKISTIEPNFLYTSSTGSSQQAPCYGDSGGPLTIGSSYSNKLLVGIVNGWGDCNVGAKGYARVSAYSDWILSVTGITGIPPIFISIFGPSTISRGVEYSYSGQNIPSGATITWTLPSNIGSITDGQGTHNVTIFTTSNGTQIIDSNIKLKVVDVNGNTKTVSYAIKLKSGR